MEAVNNVFVPSQLCIREQHDRNWIAPHLPSKRLESTRRIPLHASELLHCSPVNCEVPVDTE